MNMKKLFLLNLPYLLFVYPFDTAARFNERTEEQKLQNRPQTRQKKEDMTR